jgi:hypothetical protein
MHINSIMDPFNCQLTLNLVIMAAFFANFSRSLP